MPTDSQPHDMPETDEHDLNALPDHGDTLWLNELKSRPSSHARIVNMREWFEMNREAERKLVVEIADVQKQTAIVILKLVADNKTLTKSLAAPIVQTQSGEAMSDDLADTAHAFCRQFCRNLEQVTNKLRVKPLVLDRIVAASHKLNDFITRLDRKMDTASEDEKSGYASVREEAVALRACIEKAGGLVAFVPSARLAAHAK